MSEYRIRIFIHVARWTTTDTRAIRDKDKANELTQRKKRQRAKRASSASRSANYRDAPNPLPHGHHE